jgi:DNA-binding SARP family transcriptional activator
MKIAMHLTKHCFPLVIVLAVTVCSFQKTLAQSYGLAFTSHEAIPEQRSSLDLTHTGPVCFSNKMVLSFDLGFAPGNAVYFGYIFRLINEANQNIDLIYDQKKENFYLINQETFTEVNFKIDSNSLFKNWSKLSFSIDVSNGITCTINNKIFTTKPMAIKGRCFKIIFGSSNEHNFVSRDLPPMKIRNIGISTDGIKKHAWALDEISGIEAQDKISKKTGKVTNPVWLQPKYTNWHMAHSLTIKGSPSVAFDGDTEKIFIISTDTLFVFSAKTMTSTKIPLTSNHSNLLRGNQSIYNEQEKKLYNFYVDQKAICEFDFTKHAWNRNFELTSVTEYWQLNKFFSSDNSLYLVGGYGQLKYKNTIQKVNPATNEWQIIKPQGDFFAPRYLSALGTIAGGDTAYILGGFGSKEGDQLLSPKHFYDLLRYDVKKNTISKLHSLPDPGEQFVFANSLVVDAVHQSYYALTFPNNRFNTNLQLIKGSLTDPSYKILGHPFPYLFKDTKSFADLYYCKQSGLLLAVTFYLTDEGVTESKIYSINFSPNDIATESAVTNAEVNKSSYLFYVVLFFGVILIAVAVYFSRKTRLQRKKEPVALPGENKQNPAYIPAQPAVLKNITPVPALMHSAENIEDDAGFSEEIAAPHTSRVTLFGNFETRTVEGENITRQFTPLLKELFLLILIHSLRYNKGVSAEKLNELLWNKKEIKDAKNNRSVNLVKLKNILHKIGGLTISRDTGAWILEVDRELVYIDFLEYLEITTDHKMDTSVKASKLIELLKTGSFLQEMHYEWLDRTKAEISNDVIETLLKYSDQIYINSNPEKVIRLCDCIFNFDELNEHALKLKCKSLIALGRHTIAKNTFAKFAGKYKEIYGEDYGQGYSSLIV